MTDDLPGHGSHEKGFIDPPPADDQGIEFVFFRIGHHVMPDTPGTLQRVNIHLIL